MRDGGGYSTQHQVRAAPCCLGEEQQVERCLTLRKTCVQTQSVSSRARKGKKMLEPRRRGCLCTTEACFVADAEENRSCSSFRIEKEKKNRGK